MTRKRLSDYYYSNGNLEKEIDESEQIDLKIDKNLDKPIVTDGE